MSDQAKLSPDARVAAADIARDIARELRQYPERWTKGVPAKDANGLSCESTDRKAVCWCLWGHIQRRRPLDYAVGERFLEFIPGLSDGEGIGIFNDKDETSIADVIAICDEVAEHG